MEQKEVARVAGEAFSMITGVDLAYHDLDRDTPEKVEVGPTEKPEDEEVALDPDEDLPWPDAALVAQRWQAIGSGFVDGERYLCGQRIEEPGMTEILRHGKQRQRTAAALQLYVLKRRAPLFEVRAPFRRQKGLL
jgi:uncharacterized protein (TIGR02270 family)